MSSIFEGLQFRAGDTFVHRLDPRAKFILSISLLVVATIYMQLLPLAILLCLQVPLVVAAKVTRRWMKTLRGALVLAALVFVINILVKYVTGDYTLLPVDLATAFSISFRLVVLFTSFSVFFLTTTPDELGLTLTSWRVPYDFTFAFVTAVRFVPVLAAELQTIMDAQRSRGLELDKGNFLQRIRNFVPVLVPLIVNIFRRSIELAEAMEVKAFGASKKRTSLRQLKMRRVDFLFLLLTLIFLAAGIYARFYIPIPAIIPSE